MSNRYWHMKDGKRMLPAMCNITDSPCIDDTRYCSTCPIEYQGYNHQQGVQWLKDQTNDEIEHFKRSVDNIN